MKFIQISDELYRLTTFFVFNASMSVLYNFYYLTINSNVYIFFFIKYLLNNHHIVDMYMYKL